MLMLFYCSSFFFFKQKTAYEMRISDWSSDVCSSDLERKLCGLVAALAAVFEVGAEPGTEKLGLHPEPGSETDQAEAGRHRDDGVVRFACDDAELGPEVGQIGRAHGWNSVTNAQLVCRLLLEKKKTNNRKRVQQT